MSVYLVSFLIVVSCAMMVYGLQCYQCGQYNDGVGSITPCLNYTHMALKECPKLEQKYCIKYVSEGTIIRDCVQKCAEKETWGTATFCCGEDGCNSSSVTSHQIWLLVASVCATIFYQLTQH